MSQIQPRPQTTVILAMSLDGKIADKQRSPARFGSPQDRAHLERQIALLDAVLIGGNTLRAYGTSLPISTPQLLAERQARGQSSQPVHLLCSVSGHLPQDLKFFSQGVPHWLLTSPEAAPRYKNHRFERILVTQAVQGKIDWQAAFRQFSQLGWQRLGILGGGKLVASLLAEDLVDQIYLTICPVIIGGKDAPTPVEGEGWLAAEAKHLDLISAQTVGGEIFLHYRRR